MDMTIELWFKGSSQPGKTCLFSNGNAEIDAYLPEATLNINVTTDGNIQVENHPERGALFTLHIKGGTL